MLMTSFASGRKIVIINEETDDEIQIVYIKGASNLQPVLGITAAPHYRIRKEKDPFMRTLEKDLNAGAPEVTLKERP